MPLNFEKRPSHEYGTRAHLASLRSMAGGGLSQVASHVNRPYISESSTTIGNICFMTNVVSLHGQSIDAIVMHAVWQKGAPEHFSKRHPSMWMWKNTLHEADAHMLGPSWHEFHHTALSKPKPLNTTEI